MCRNGFLLVDSWRGVADEAIRVFVLGGGRGQEDRYVSEISDRKHRSGNCPHESKIKAFFANRDRKKS